jgi:hypothetical protein
MPYIKGLTTKDLRQHVLDLRNKHGVTVYAWCRRLSQCHALTDRDEIRSPSIDSHHPDSGALQEVELLKQQLKRSGDGGLFDLKLDEPKDIARSIVSNVICYKAEAIHEALGAALKAEKKSHTGEANRRSEYQ